MQEFPNLLLSWTIIFFFVSQNGHLCRSITNEAEQHGNPVPSFAGYK